MGLHERRAGDVYQPAEDTRLLAGAALEHLNGNNYILDVGTGSGYVGARLDEELDGSVVGVDTNPHACRQAIARGLSVIRGDLVAGFRSDVFDAVVCNPPYLPTAPEDERGDWMATALSGGETGRAVIDSLLDTVGRVLTPEGEVFLLVSSLTGVEAVRTRAARNGFTGEAVAEDAFPFETLSVFRFVRE